MADRRNALEKHLGIPEDRAKYDSYRRQALLEHVGEALTSQNYAAAQVYALLLVAEKLDAGTADVRLVNSDELGVDIATNMAPDLQRIADAIG